VAELAPPPALLLAEPLLVAVEADVPVGPADAPEALPDPAVEAEEEPPPAELEDEVPPLLAEAEVDPPPAVALALEESE
jgi:hypothetical protein